MIEPNNIYNMDCLKGLEYIENGTIDLILTDAPFIISKKSGYTNTKLKKYENHKIDFGEWDKKPLELESLFKEYYRVLKKGGTLLFFYDLWKMQEIKEVAEKNKFKQPRFCIWVKNNPVPINSKLNYLSNAKECFVTFTKGSKPTFNAQYHKGIFEFPLCHGLERTEHPTQKPLAFIKELVQIHSNENAIVLDTFMGSGTTAQACKETNRQYIGFELSKDYYNICLERLNQ